MTDELKRRSRKYDAARTKEIILDVAEEAFAELGYSAARIDEIAKASGYNKSLIYQYFGDKLSLYTEVIKRADRLGDETMGRLFMDLLSDESLTSDAAKFRTFLEMTIREMYRFLNNHPRYRRIHFWEVAEEWKTWNQITYQPDDITQFIELAKAAQRNGIIRKDFDPSMLKIFITIVTITSIQSISRYGDILGMKNSEQLLDQITKFVVHGVLEPSLL
ncbi:TetR/AcrR family transcriptional regulator [Paenibacillus sp. P26]|nr:TetR/AcrR family transcriptional regulator [Paenibacillus sp. P26]UUZ89643.1 TetR/AcrR family transcriptional regulator [Paenibacillus sp. P25]